MCAGKVIFSRLVELGFSSLNSTFPCSALVCREGLFLPCIFFLPCIRLGRRAAAQLRADRPVEGRGEGG